MAQLDLNMHVLVVDDVPVMRGLIIKTLKEMGFTRCSECENGADAWSAIQKLHASNPIQFIISDVTMPLMTGIELLKKVRGDARFKGIPFLIVSAESEKALILDAIQSGVNQYLMKPFLPDQIKQKVHAVFDAIEKKKAA
jgi:two-component system chemotaxis response regulator CheY